MSDTAPVTRPTKSYERILCRCCRSEVLAVRRGRKIIIEAERHGRRHFAVIDLVIQSGSAEEES